MRRKPPIFNLSFQSVHTCQPHPFLQFMAATNRARHPSGSSERPCHCLSPWQLRCPRRTLVPKRVQWLITDPWLPIHRLQSLDGSRCRRSAILQTGDGGTPSHSDPSAVTPVAVPGLATTVICHLSCKATRGVKWLSLLQHVKACSRQFVRQRLDGHHVVRLGLLSLVEPFCLSIEAHRINSRLHKRPGEVLVAVLRIAFAFLLAIAGVDAINAARVGGKVAGASESLDRTCLQQDGRRQNLADAWCAG